jgi:hypothetical protein
VVLAAEYSTAIGGKMSEQKVTPDLSPCPFCGSSDVDGNGWADGKGDTGPQCLFCGATAESVAMWNNRCSCPVLDGVQVTGSACPVHGFESCEI